MSNLNPLHAWESYKERELREATPTLQALGFELEPTQPHTTGERFLMTGSRDVGGGGYKLVLLGSRVEDGKRVIIKVSSEEEGRAEIEREREARHTLQNLRFAYYVLFAPEEVLYKREEGRTIYITTHIEQEKPFLERPLREQFSLALKALKTQEGLHATTHSHLGGIRRTFPTWGAQYYLDTLASFGARVGETPALAKTFARAHTLLLQHKNTIEQYCGFLTHADFVPHNLRIEGDTIYLLDYASLHFGNKHESWARFINFMLLYNAPLHRALVEYVAQNRTAEESLSLRLMRIYKLGFLLCFYAESARKTTHNQHQLSVLRVEFWHTVLRSLIDDVPFPEALVADYTRARDTLRSEEEKLRQKGLH